jgi:monofunctional biosynthetic peptidoglycan transglycosylase
MRQMRRVARYVAVAAAFGFGYLAYLYLTLPDVRALRTQNLERTAFMELRESEARAEGRKPKHVQQWMPYSRISPHLKRAVLVAEDAGFWGHEGIDLAEIRKSLETDWERGALTRGASTITQQLAKNLYLSPSRNPFRKLRELFIARRLERELSKTRIFELYLNDIEWGDGIYGADAAARTYFGVPASAVDPDQAALMAGAIVNPRELRISSPNGRLRARQRIIRSRMANVTPPPIVATPAPAEPASDEPLPAEPAPDTPAEPALEPNAVEPEPAQTPQDALPSPEPTPAAPPEPAPAVPRPFPGAP